MIEAIKRGFGNLLVFSGRDGPSQFWPYAGFVVAILFVAFAAVLLPVMAVTFSKMAQFAAAHPDQATVTSGPGQYSITIEGSHPELLPDIGAFVIPGCGMGMAVVALLAAAVTRRLHDRGRAGWWGLLPLPFLIVGLGLMPVVLASFGTSTPSLRLFFLLFFNNILYLAALGGLVILLVGAGTAGANRFGETPAK